MNLEKSNFELTGKRGRLQGQLHQLWFLISTIYFQSAAVVGGRIANATPAQSPKR